MSVKTTGAEWKRYYSDPEQWPAGAWHEDTYITIDGEYDDDADLADVADSASIVITGGIYLTPSGHKAISLESHFKRWLKKQGTVSIAVECDKADYESVKAAIVAANGRIK